MPVSHASFPRFRAAAWSFSAGSSIRKEAAALNALPVGELLHPSFPPLLAPGFPNGRSWLPPPRSDATFFPLLLLPVLCHFMCLPRSCVSNAAGRGFPPSALCSISLFSGVSSSSGGSGGSGLGFLPVSAATTVVACPSALSFLPRHLSVRRSLSCFPPDALARSLSRSTSARRVSRGTDHASFSSCVLSIAARW